jgi:putative membrane protein
MAYHYLFRKKPMIHLIVSWLVSALALWLVAQIIPGIKIKDFKAALIGTIIIAIVNVVIGWPVRFIFSPITFITLGLFRLIINAFLLKVSSLFTPGFTVTGFLNAVIGALVLTILQAILRSVVFSGPFSGTSL